MQSLPLAHNQTFDVKVRNEVSKIYDTFCSSYYFKQIFIIVKPIRLYGRRIASKQQTALADCFNWTDGIEAHFTQKQVDQMDVYIECIMLFTSASIP